MSVDVTQFTHNIYVGRTAKLDAILDLGFRVIGLKLGNHSPTANSQLSIIVHSN